MNSTLGFPPADDLYGNLQKIDYVKFGESIIFVVATICAIVVGVVSYFATVAQLWWLDNGETIVNSVKTNSNRVVDFVFYTSTDQ
jgi:hypothetical protein